jgi:hypothetical protein
MKRAATSWPSCLGTITRRKAARTDSLSPPPKEASFWLTEALREKVGTGFSQKQCGNSDS